MEEDAPLFSPDVCPAASGKRGKNSVKLGMALVDKNKRPLVELFRRCACGTGPALQRGNIDDWVPPLPSSTAHLLPSLRRAASPPHVTGLFGEGGDVSVPSRMQPGVNKPGGVGVVTAVYSKTVGGLITVLYLVKYMMGGAEQDISESLISRFTPVSDQQRRRSVGAATTAAAEERAPEVLARENSALRDRVRDLLAEAVGSRLKLAALRAGAKEAAKDSSKLEETVRALAMEQVAGVERMHASIDGLLAEADEAAAATSAELIEEKRKEMLLALSAQRRTHADKVREL